MMGSLWTAWAAAHPTLSMLLEHGSGALALALNVYGYLNPDDRRLRLVATTGAGLMSTHNALIGAYTAASLHLLFLCRNLLSMRLVNTRSTFKLGLCGGFMVATLGLAWLTWQGPISLALALGSCAVTYAFFYLAGAPLRWVIGCNILIWMANAVVFGSVWQFASGALGAWAAFTGGWRLYRAAAQAEAQTPPAMTAPGMAGPDVCLPPSTPR